jgi:cytochrome b
LISPRRWPILRRMKRPSPTSHVRVWDIPTRLFHWSLVFCLLSAWASFRYAEALGDPTMKWHRYNGYAILVLIVFRLLWGLFGSSTSRWTSFVRSPVAAAGYGLDLLRGRDRKFLGHNPLGTYMVLALLFVVGAQAFAGLFIVEHNDTTWGPLYKWASEATQKKLLSWHLWAFYWIILPLVGAHVTANVLYGAVKKEPLIRAMVTGRKPEADYEDADEVELETKSRALLCLVAAVAIVFGGIVLAGGKLFY